MPKSWSLAESFSDRIWIPILFLLVSESTELQVLPSNKCLHYSVQSSSLASEEVLGESAYSAHACSAASAVPDSLRPHGLYPARLLCPWDSPGKNTGGGCHVLLQGIFPTQGLNSVSCTGRWILYHWATREAQFILCLFHNTLIEQSINNRNHISNHELPAGISWILVWNTELCIAVILLQV